MDVLESAQPVKTRDYSRQYVYSQSATKRNWLWCTFQRVLQVLFQVYFRYRGYAYDKLPAQGGALLLSNHQSYLDPLLIGLPLSRPVSFLARESLFKIPVIGWILKHTYTMPIKRSAASTQSLREAVQRMEHGYLVGLYPEGTRTTDGSVGAMKPGFISIIRRTNMPVYPIGIAGAWQAFPRSAWFPRPKCIAVYFGPAMDADALERLTQRGHEAELLNYVHDQISTCHAKAKQMLER